MPGSIVYTPQKLPLFKHRVAELIISIIKWGVFLFFFTEA
ncbi:hypothetical protein A0R60_1532 [Enterobacter asburiae]|nr:hypothetical protein A0R60_1532 [Enterobacter asburiae]